MSGLRPYEHDVAPLSACGDLELSPPAEALLLALVRAHLVRPGAPEPTAARWVYARWKPATSLTAGFELDYADGERRWVTCKRYADGKAAELAGRRERDVAAEAADDRLQEHALALEHRMHLWAPPFDRELPGLERACDLRRAKRWFFEQGLFPGRVVRSSSSCARLLRYKPERRAVLRLELRLRPADGGPKTEATLAVRALPPPEATRVAAARLAWQAGAAARIAPRLLAHEARTGLLFEEWLDVEACAHDDFAVAREAGLLLARIHAEADPSSPRSPESDSSAAAALLATQPSLGAAAASLGTVPRGPRGPGCWIHGDFHPDQLARARVDGELRLLDLDRLGLGSPLEDLAAWVADRLAERPNEGLDAASAELLDGYRSAGGRAQDKHELAEAVALALVQRAAGALRRLEVGAVEKAARLLELQREIAPGGARSA